MSLILTCAIITLFEHEHQPVSTVCACIATVELKFLLEFSSAQPVKIIRLRVLLSR